MNPTKHRSESLYALVGSSQSYVRAASALTFGSGLLLLGQPILRHFHHERIPRYVLPPDAFNLADLTTVVLGLILLVLAYELLLRKRVAWYLALAVSLASGFNDIAFRHPQSSTFFTLAVIAVLIAGNQQFVGMPARVHLRRGLAAVAVSIIIALSYGTFGFWLVSQRDFGRTFSFTSAFNLTLREYAGLGSGNIIARTRYSRWFLYSLKLVGATTAVYAVYSVLRPLAYEYKTLPAERAKAKALLMRYGTGDDDYFKLWPEDKSYFFNTDGSAFIAYGVARGVAVALGNPTGKPSAIPALLNDFTRYCLQNGWLVIMVQADELYETSFTKTGYQQLVIGADAIIGLNTFATETARNKHFRNIGNRFAKNGFSTERSVSPHAPKLLDEVQAITQEWLQLPNRREWHFFTGRSSPAYFAHTPLFIVRDADGKAVAFANELPTFTAGHATIDLMRHRQDIPSNTMDFLFLELLLRLQQEGYQQFNLGLSPVAGTSPVSNLSGRLAGELYRLSQRFFVSGNGLNQFKNKFKPDWQPRYVYYLGGPAALPHLALAVAKLAGDTTHT